MARTPALIVGGGPAGAAAAIALARGGTRALLVERTRETGDALCGGFLSWRTLDTLAGLGVAADALNPVRVGRTRLLAGGVVREAALPRPALAVSRRRLDALLLDRAARVAAVERGVTVRAVEDSRLRLADGASLAPDTLFLATGKHDLRGLARPAPAAGEDPTIGLRVRIDTAPGLSRLVGDAIELHLFARGYAGLVLQEDGSANLCLAVRRSRLAAAGGPAALLAALGAENPRLGERLAYMATDAPVDAVANVPYGWRARTGARGLFRLGDQAGVIPSLAGEGMGIALASGIAAASAFLKDGVAAGATWQPAFARTLRRPIAVAVAARDLAESRAARPAVRLLPPALIRLAAAATRIPAAP